MSMSDTSGTEQERVARNGSMVIRGSAVVSDSNGPFRLVLRVPGIENPVKLDTSTWVISWAKDEPTSERAAMQLLIDDLNVGRREGIIYTYGHIQERLRGILEMNITATE